MGTDHVGGEGYRLRKAGGATGTTYFVPDVDGSMLAENDSGTWIDYIWLNGRLVARSSNGQLMAIHADQVGRPETVTDASQKVVWRARNLAFDHTVIQDDIGGLNLGFPGQYYDAERWTWNNGYRDYNPGFGRYLESDPVGLAGGVNTYAYVGGNPVSFVDVLGLCDDDAKTLETVKVTASADDGGAATIPSPIFRLPPSIVFTYEPIKPPITLLAPSNPVGKKVDDFLSKQLVRRLSFKVLEIRKFDFLAPTPITFGVSLMFHSPDLGGCNNGVCADEVQRPSGGH